MTPSDEAVTLTHRFDCDAVKHRCVAKVTGAADGHSYTDCAESGRRSVRSVERVSRASLAMYVVVYACGPVAIRKVIVCISSYYFYEEQNCRQGFGCQSKTGQPSTDCK